MPFDGTRTESELARNLKAAKALIDKPEKWCQGQIIFQGRYCALGALRMAIVGYIDGPYTESQVAPYLKAVHLLSGVFSPNLLECEPNVATYNDHHATTHEMLMAKFDEAIARAEASA